MWKGWVVTDNSEASSDDDNIRPTEHVLKKCKSVGKVGKGEDFWSIVEKWLGQKINLWGSDMSTLEWDR